MSGIGGGGVNTIVNPFAPVQTTTQGIFPIPPQTSTFVNPAITPTPTPSQLPLTISTIVTEILPGPSSSTKLKSTKLKPTFTRTVDDDNNINNKNNNSNNTISSAAIIFSIMISFIIVGGCIALILARAGSKKKKPTINEQRNLYGDETNESEKRNVYGQINNISPPLNLPPPPPPRRSPPLSPQRSPPSSPRRSLPSTPRDSQGSPPLSSRHSLPIPPLIPPLLPIPRHPPIGLYRNPSLTRHVSSRKTSRNYHDPERLDPNYPYQKYSQLSSQSARIAEEQTNIDKPP